MRKRNVIGFLLAIAWCSLLFPGSAWSFICPTQTVDVPVPASTFTNKSSTFTLPSGIIRNCEGSIDGIDGLYQDAMRVKTVRYHSSLGDFTRTLQVAGGRSSVSTGATAVASAQTISASNLCVWPDAYCSTSSYHGTKNTLGISVKLAGTPVELASGTVLATVILERRSKMSEGFNAENYTITFTLQDKVEPPVYTCTISDYDATITLPSVRRSDLENNGAGKYAAISKPLNLNLQCNENTDVTITFNATALSGTDNVLKNTLSGNDNVGFQLLYGGNPVKVNNTLLLRTGASGATNLKFDVYYYYKGSGAVTAGAIKSGAEFTLDYK